MERRLLKPEYLGDGVYVHDEGYRIVLAVNHHMNKVVYLEENEIRNLYAFIKRTNILEDEEEKT